MKRPVYLLINDISAVCWSLDKSELEQLAQSSTSLVCQDVLEIEIDEAHIKDLVKTGKHATIVNCHVDLTKVPKKYYDKREDFLKHPPAWYEAEGLRIYVLFNKDGECFWSPSGNNLNSYFKKNPEAYLTMPCRVEITKEQYIALYGYFEFWTDNW